jgi:hypothetical protein
VAGQIATAYYFTHFLIILPLFGFLDNILGALGSYTSPAELAYIRELAEIKRKEKEEKKKNKSRLVGLLN